MKEKKSANQYFTRHLLEWHYKSNHRTMPWKGEPDPYKIWLSEIILQQTRVEQGLSYYLRFTEAYPDIFSLAAASDEEVFRKWEGLGYYSRCRNLLHTARTIVKDYHGIFPADYSALLKLKGVGPYTAAAIASFAFGLPHAVVDGNVSRVLARYYEVFMPVDSPEGKKYFQELAQKVLDFEFPGTFNQAIMDFGATICKPITPDCRICPIQSSCRAFASGTTQNLPVKNKKAPKKERYFIYLVLQSKKMVWVSERKGRDIWRHLNEFYLEELGNREELLHFDPLKLANEAGWKVKSLDAFAGTAEQTLTHQVIKTRFMVLELSDLPEIKRDGRWINLPELSKFAFPGTITRFLIQKGLRNVEP